MGRRRGIVPWGTRGERAEELAMAFEMPTASEIEMYRALVEQESAALLDQLGGVRPADWSRASPCEGWDVLDVLVHLRLGTAFNAALVRNALDGKTDAPWAAFGIPDGADPLEYAGRIHRGHHAEGPGANLEGFRDEVDAYRALLDGISEEDLDRPTWFFGGLVPLRMAIAARTFDVVLHASDIRRPLRIRPPFSPEGRLFAGKYVSRTLGNFWQPDLFGNGVGTIRLDVDGDQVNVVASPAGLQYAAPDGPADAVLGTDGGTWALLTWRKLPLDDAERVGAATGEGDRALLRRFLGAIRTP
jgi:uncharacterized protein (TIGR03083 family)